MKSKSKAKPQPIVFRKAQKVAHDWRGGIAFWTAIDLKTVEQRDVVLFDFGHVKGPRAMMVIDAGGHLAFVVLDRNGTVARATTSQRVGKFFLITELKRSRDKWTLRVEINGRIVASSDFDGDFDIDRDDGLHIFGCDLAGKRAADLRLGEHGMLPKLTAGDKENLLGYLQERFKLSLDN